MPFNPFEQYRKAREQEEVKKAEEVIEAGPPPLTEIISDREDSEVLRLILEREKNNKTITEDKIRIFEEYLAGNPNVDQQAIQDVFQILSPRLEELKRAKEYSRESLKYLTPERIRILAANNDEFRMIVNLLGPEKTQEFLRNYLYRLWVLDSTKADSLNQQLKAIREAEKNGQRLGENMMSIAEKYRIPSEELERVFASDNPQKALEELIKSHMGTLDKLRNWIGRGQLLKERLGQFRLDELKQYNDDIDKALNEAASIIKDIVFGTEKGQEFFQRAFRVAAGLEKGPMAISTSIIEGINDLRNQEDLREAIIEEARLQGQEVDNLDALRQWWEDNRTNQEILNSIYGRLRDKKQKKGSLLSLFSDPNSFFRAIFDEMISIFKL